MFECIFFINSRPFLIRFQLKERGNLQTLHQAVHLPAVIRLVIQTAPLLQAILHRVVRHLLAALHPVAPQILIELS